MLRFRNRRAARRGGPRRFGAGVLVLALLTGVGRAADDPGRGWTTGPVRVLLEAEEIRRYEALKTPEARAAFVETFWRGLDSDPSTERNEFREQFEGRCAEVERRFSTARGPGWRTDRGRVYLFLGEPDAIRPEPGDAWSISKEVWQYERAGAAGALRLVFYRGVDGEHRLNPRPRGESFSGGTDRDRLMKYWAVFAGVPRPYRRALLDFLIGSVGGFTPVASEDGVRDRSPSGEPTGDRESPAVWQDSYFFRASDGRVVALWVLAVARAPESDGGATAPYLGAAYVTAASDAGRSTDPLIVGLERLQAASPDGRELYAGRTVLDPGKEYRVRFAFTDEDRSILVVRSARIVVPDLGDGPLTASSLVPAESFGPQASDAPAVFAIGSETVVPRIGATFGRGETLRLYFQVYGAAVDPSSKRARVDVAFRFEHLRRGAYRKFQRPFRVRGASGASLGLALPVGDWPAGSYRVTVDLADRVSGAETTTGCAFSIRD